MAILYHYDAATGEYTGSSESRTCPKTGQPLIPANATLEPVILPLPDETAVWDNGAWVSIEDHRGETVWRKDDAQSVQIKDLGPIPAEFTDTSPDSVTYPAWDEASNAWVEDSIQYAEARKNEILSRLSQLDVFIPRGLEDTWEALEASGSLNKTTLPQIQQDRLAEKESLRAELAGLK